MPLHDAGDGDTTVGVIALPHASFTVGAVGTTASAGQFTVDEPFAGRKFIRSKR